MNDDPITIEIFFIDRPLNGFGAVEIIDPNTANPAIARRPALRAMRGLTNG